MAQKPAIRRLKLRKKRGSLFAGEIGGYPDPLAQRMIDEGAAFEVDEDGRPIGNVAAAEPASEQPATGGDEQRHVFNEATDPFITDGLSKTASKALHAIDIHTVADLKAWMQVEGNDLDAIEDLTDAQVSKIRELYL